MDEPCPYGDLHVDGLCVHCERKQLQHDVQRLTTANAAWQRECEHLTGERISQEDIAYRLGETLAERTLLLARCVRQVNGNRGAWEDMAEPWSPDFKTARAKAMAECDALLADIERALAKETP